MKDNETQLSAKSKAFLEDLRVYLFSSGKHSDDIEEIVEELEVHLTEAEKQGKPIEKIIGQSPKAYMDDLANEMSLDGQSSLKYISLIIFGAFSFTIVGDIIRGTLSYSLLELIGYICIIVISIFALLGVFKYISGNRIPKGKQIMFFYVLGLLPIGLFVGLIYLNRAIETPMIHFGMTGTIIIAMISLILLVAISWWAKTWILIIILALLNLPNYLLRQTALQENTQLLLSTLATFVGIAAYFVIVNKINKY